MTLFLTGLFTREPPSRLPSVTTRATLEAAGWSYGALADLLFVSPRTVRAWCSGRSEVPPPIAAWLATVAGFFADHPPPEPPDTLRP